MPLSDEGICDRLTAMISLQAHNPDGQAYFAVGRTVTGYRRQDAITLPTYLPAAPDKNPMFFEKRVYEGSSGRIYPPAGPLIASRKNPC